MCLNPTLIRNPWFKSFNGNCLLKDTKSQFIPVPCGHCSECVATRALGIRQRCELEEMNGHPFMVLLTYSNDMIPYHVCSTGYKVQYADFSDVTKMFKRLRKSNAIGRPFRYLVISERGGKKGRPHFHAIVYVKKFDSDNIFDIINLESVVYDSILHEWRKNFGSTRKPDYKPLCKPVEYIVAGKRFGTYGCHYIVPSLNDGSCLGATAYVSKYFLKRDPFTINLQQALRLNLPFEEYKKVWNLVKSRYISSLNFGFGLYDNYNAKKVSRSERMEILSKLDTFKHVRASLIRSMQTQDRPRYYELESGKPIPLSRYFYHIDNLYDYHIYSHFKELNNDFGDYSVIDDRDTAQKLYEKSIKDKKINVSLSFTDFTDLM